MTVTGCAVGVRWIKRAVGFRFRPCKVRSGDWVGINALSVLKSGIWIQVLLLTLLIFHYYYRCKNSINTMSEASFTKPVWIHQIKDNGLEFLDPLKKTKQNGIRVRIVPSCQVCFHRRVIPSNTQTFNLNSWHLCLNKSQKKSQRAQTTYKTRVFFFQLLKPVFVCTRSEKGGTWNAYRLCILSTRCARLRGRKANGTGLWAGFSYDS